MSPGRPVAAVAAAAAVVLLAGLGVVGLDRADRSTALSEDDAVARFRAASPSPSPTPGPTASASAVPAPPRTTAAPTAVPPAAPGAAAPAPAGAAGATPAAPQPRAAAPAAQDEAPSGVYRYATEGFEEVDALGGARHDYPSTTTVTYSRSGCGTEERWQPLQERVGSTFTCAGAAGGELRATRQRREFFGQSQEKSYRCDPGVLVRPRDPRPGQAWAGECRTEDSRIALAGRVVGLEELVVEGRRVPVVHVRLQGTLTGSTRGRSDREVWLARSDGLLVQAVGTTDTDADTAGGTVRYVEEYRLRLQSLTPRR